MLHQIEREALDRLLQAIDQAELVDDPSGVYGPVNAYAKAYGIAQYRVACIQHAAEGVRRAMGVSA